MKDWIPEREFKKADFTYNAKKNVSEKIQSNAKIVKPYQFPRIEELNAKKNPSKQLQNTSIPKETPPGAKKSVRDQLKEMMELLVKSNLQASADILRKWYWEKSEQTNKKIFVILRSLSKNMLIELFQFFTLMERQQLIEIYKKNYPLTTTEILTNRNQFIQFLQELA